MSDRSKAKDRLNELLELAQSYRGWNRRQLGRALGRDPSKLVPDSGVPKLDLVVELANVLDWQVEDVARVLVGSSAPPELKSHANASFDELDRQASAAHKNGDSEQVVAIAKAAFLAAQTDAQRADACNREGNGWEAMGRFRNAVEAFQRGLRQHDAPVEMKLLLRSNLACTYYALWYLYEARGIATDVIESLPDSLGLEGRIAKAMAHYARGNSLRRVLPDDAEPNVGTASLAIESLRISEAELCSLFNEYDHPPFAAIAHTCRGGINELRAALGEAPASECLAQVDTEIADYEARKDELQGDWLESFGWWAVFGCAIARRHRQEVSDADSRLASYCLVANDVAERSGNWSLRERAFSVEFARRQEASADLGLIPKWDLTMDQVRILTGTMGRVPAFEETGWRIISDAASP